MRVTAIVSPPPTPNGDLHLGHLSGPYLGADVLRRFLALRGEETVSAISVDAHQSYVVTSAERLGVEPLELAKRSHADIAATLAAALMEFDLVGYPDREYGQYVQGWFSALFAAGCFERTARIFPYDCQRERFLFESFASGRCPHCLAATKGNICEDCGHPNDPAGLLDLRPTGQEAGATIEFRRQDMFVFDLERHRTGILNFFASEVGETLRPTQKRLLRELLDRELEPVPVTFPGSWGLSAPFPDSDGLVLNPWVEMLPGHYYWLEKEFQARGSAGELVSLEPAPDYVQCLGFDNSFYYLVVHVALALAAREQGLPALLPTAFRVNEFYQIGATKFSTSDDAVILGRDFLATESADCLRFHLCRTNPELQRSEFRDDEYKIAATQFSARWKAIAELVEASPATAEDPREVAEAHSLISRFELAYGPPHSSLRLASEVLCQGITATIAAARSGRPFRLLAKHLAIGALPIVPSAAQDLLRRLGHDGDPTWPAVASSGLMARRQLVEEGLE